jgi:hypothetical protein
MEYLLLLLDCANLGGSDETKSHSSRRISRLFAAAGSVAFSRSSGRYTLGFVSTNPKVDGKLRKLKVEVVDTDVDHDGKADKLKVCHKEQLGPVASQQREPAALRSK